MPRVGFRDFHPRTPRHWIERYQDQLDATRIVNGVVHIPLTQGKVGLLDESDYPYVRDRSWRAGPRANEKFYVVTSIHRPTGKDNLLSMHRLLMFGA